MFLTLRSIIHHPVCTSLPSHPPCTYHPFHVRHPKKASRSSAEPSYCAAEIITALIMPSYAQFSHVASHRDLSYCDLSRLDQASTAAELPLQVISKTVY